MEGDEQARLAVELASYIHAQSVIHRARALPPNSAQRSGLAGCFSRLDLARVRIADARETRVVEPAFYAHLRELGALGLQEFSLFGAATSDNVVVAHLPIDNAVLFHELVHVMQ